KAELEVETLLNYHYQPLLQTTSSELQPLQGKKGKGLYGEYFTNPDFKGKPQHLRVDEEINFNYGRGSAFSDMPSDNFSVRWTGRFVPEKSGVYRFILTSDDGSRLYLNNELVIDHWGAHAATSKSYETLLEAGKGVSIKIEYNEYGQDALIKFGWMFVEDSEKTREGLLRTRIFDREGRVIAQDEKKVALKNNQQITTTQQFELDHPHLWQAKADPYLYTLHLQLEDLQGHLLDEIEQPFGIRFFKVDKENGLILNGQPYPLYGVCRHQEWEGLGPALSDKHHEKDIEFILEMGASGVRLAHYQQADKMYSLCDENGLVVWAEIPNTPAYRANHPAYLQNCKDQLTELIKQNYNHPSILFWGLYNEIDIPFADVKALHETAKQLDPFRLTTQADFVQVTDRHFVTDVAAWNWYFGWYYGQYGDYLPWYDNVHSKYPELICGLSEYGAGGCISQQQENPERPDPFNGRFFPEQYQRLYHEQVWSLIKDRKDIWCKFIWNMFDFSWTNVKRGDRDFINHKGLITHDRKVKKDAFYFYKANWSNEPVLYILSRRNTVRTESQVPVEVYTNLDEVELYVNGTLVSRKKMASAIHKISWQNITLIPGRNQISVIGYKGNNTFTDACEWTFYNHKK
ncbi:MAG: PA14 domain-containing protein, partial [candidate division KSB1 bacterium]|nr:PA14 domain-containing protein [candidate division KSB1 bacterium]